MAELDASGNHHSPEKRIIVFPGVELTLALPCQALLLFDCDVNPTDLERGLAALGITPSPREAAKAARHERLAISDLNDIYQRLNEHVSLRNRFIVLPNVNDSGEDTILRHGFFEHYKKMSCVGGYVDGGFADHRRRHIVDGNDDAWGNKCIGVVQTSDSRERDFSRLGAYPTWIKWSIGSTEALRQACLAPDSRIRYSSPLLPNSYISRIEISDSRYFGPLSVEFNQQLNTIIGGRGSGKSTILEYVRWALCDQAYVHHGDDASELPDYERRRRSLVSATLTPSRGNVTVHYMRHGVPHRIRREGGTGRTFLTLADQAEQETTEEVIQSLVQLQGYSQKQLSHVGVRTQELNRLLTTPIAQELSNVEAEIESGASLLRQAFERVESRRALLSQLQAHDLDRASKEAQLSALTEEIRDLPEEQRREIDAHPLFAAGQRASTAFRSAIEGASGTLVGATSAIERIIRDLPEVGISLPLEPLTAAREAISTSFRQLVSLLLQANASVGQLRESLREHFTEVQSRFDAHRDLYDAAASENQVIQERLESLRTLGGQISNLEETRGTLTTALFNVNDADEALLVARLSWTEAISRKIALLESQATRLTSDSLGELRVQILHSQELEPLRMALQDAIRGAGITTPDKFDSLFQGIASSPIPLDAWQTVGEELVELARVGPHLSTGAYLPQSARFRAAGFIDSELRRIASRLTPSSAFQCALLYPQSIPVFEYRTGGQNYVPFQDASPGQQATALIGLLLNQSAGPLVIDQPEDDLDNSTILQVAERLWDAKEKRQIIFSTHNPNLVVIGDAELVLHCAYQEPVQAARVYVAHKGAIDTTEVREVIAQVMEGGAEAFDLRRAKYGF